MNSVFVFGGSFDPPHIGHVSVMTNILSFYPSKDYLPVNYRDFFFVIPAYEHGFNKELTAFEHRMNMCFLAFDIFKGKVSVLDLEKQYGVKYTVNLLRALKTDYPDQALKLVIGSDNDIDRWKDPQGIKSLAEIITLPRNTGLVPSISSTELRAMIKAGNKEYKRWIPAKVCEYIEKNGLYHDTN